jgi:hypothetical protein
MNSGLSVIANDLLSVGGIERVVSIDDLHRAGAELDEMLGEVSVMEEAAIESKVSPILNLVTGDREIVISAIRSRWNELDPELKKILQAAVVSETRATNQGEKLGNDLSTASKLPVLFQQRLISVSYRQWLSRKDELIANDMPPTLLLVDLDFTGEGIPGQAGLDLIKQLLRSDPEARIFCGLLTNAYPLKGVHEQWRALCDEHELAPNRFVLIPKEALYEDETRFLALVKLVILNGPANELTTIVRESFATSVETAIERLGKIDPYEFEQIVCVSSLTEGVWEPDTLARIFAVYHKIAVRQSIHAHEKVYEVANNLRKLSSVKTGGWGEDTPRAVELRRLEWFEEAADLNQQLSPIELGDIFEVECRPEKRYSLVSQPCDLMVRKDGKRDGTVQNGVLLEVSKWKGEKANDFGFMLEFFEANVDWRVNLRDVTTIVLEVLDLSSLQVSGRCEVSVRQETPTKLNDAWTARAPRLRAWAKKVIGRSSELVKQGLRKSEADKIAGNLWLGKFASCVIDEKTESIRYNVTRVGRLRQPRAGALLSRYANAMAREAFEHDLARHDQSGVKAAPAKNNENAVEGISEPASPLGVQGISDHGKATSSES